MVHRHGLSRFDAARQAFVPQVSAANPLVRDCLTRGAVVNASGTVWVTTRAGCLRLLPTAALLPSLNVVLHQAEVDGAPRAAAALGTLPAGPHRLGFNWQALALSQASAVQYQYRLLGY